MYTQLSSNTLQYAVHTKCSVVKLISQSQFENSPPQKIHFRNRKMSDVELFQIELLEAPPLLQETFRVFLDLEGLSLQRTSDSTWTTANRAEALAAARVAHGLRLQYRVINPDHGRPWWQPPGRSSPDGQD